MSAPINLSQNHMAPSQAIRDRLGATLGLPLERIGDAAANDKDAEADYPYNQAVYVTFLGEDAEAPPAALAGLSHLWAVGIAQRRDYQGWEDDYGRLRAQLYCALDEWQPGDDIAPLELLPQRSGIDDYPGLRADLTVWRVAEQTFL